MTMLAVAVAVATAVAVPTTPPLVPPALKATIIQFANVVPPGDYNGTIWYDRANLRQCSKADMIDPVAPISYIGTPGQWENITYFYMNDGIYYGQNGLPRLVVPQTNFEDLFAFVPSTKYNSTGEYYGRNCTVWDFAPNNKTFMRYYAEVGSELPVAIFSNTTGHGLPGQPTVQEILTSIFSDVIADKSKIDFSVFDEFNRTEIENPPTCRPKNSAPIVEDMTVYIFHPSDEWNISGQDIADLVGDTYFVCFDSTNTDRDHYQYISEYSLSVNTNWGQYRMCNNYPPDCVGAEDFYVGREASGGGGAVQAGQCSDNTETGSWYSLPTKGQCLGDDTPASGNCTWKINKRVKTINAKCMLGRGFVDACTADERLPYPTASHIFYSSFDDEDGCAAINPPNGV